MEDYLTRTWFELVDRVGGPLTFRMILQPLAASIIAIRAGLRDGRRGRSPYFWAMFTNSLEREAMLRDGWKDVAKVVATAIVIDLIYQLIVFQWFYLLQALIVAATLAILPYLLIRGLVNRIVRSVRPHHLAPAFCLLVSAPACLSLLTVI